MRIVVGGVGLCQRPVEMGEGAIGESASEISFAMKVVVGRRRAHAAEATGRLASAKGRLGHGMKARLA